jgi:hypothetical protein
MTNAEIDFIMTAIELTAMHFQEWKKDYMYDAECNEYSFKGIVTEEKSIVEDWFNSSDWS